MKLETELLIAYKLNYITEETYLLFQSNLIELEKMISSFKTKILKE